MSPSESRTGRLPGGPTASGPAAGGPRILDRYVLVRRLGAGAFGTVWMARDERLQRDVAVKILARELIAGGRFEREARAAARLSHPGIVTVYEAAVDDEGAYLVSELVRGETLGALLAEGRLSDHDVLEIGVGLCEALAHAHEQGVVHRDVKPSNVLVPSSGRSNRSPCKLTDFGVARLIDSDSLTLSGDVIGTLNYMAPEQAAGLEAGEPADLYSLALIVYEALSGVNPLRSSPGARRARHAVQLPSLRRQRRDLPVPMAEAIDRALRPRVDERGSLADLRDGLAGALEHVDETPGVVTGALDRGPRDPDSEREPLWSAREPEPALAQADPSRLIWQARALAGAGAAAAAAWLDHLLLRPGDVLTVPIAVLAVIAGGLTVLLPRIGWLALAAYLCAVAAIQGAVGAATIVAAAAIVPIVLLPAAPGLWPVAAAAPTLGFLGLAGGWPALAGYAHSPWRRMMLGAIGWVWLLLAGPLAGRALYEPRPGRAVHRDAWEGSVTGALDHVLSPLVHAGTLAAVVVWALAAAILPWVVDRRRPAFAVVAAIVWAAALTIATPIAVGLLNGSRAGSSTASTAAAGACAAAVLALAPLIIDRARRAARRSRPDGRVP